MPDYPDHTKPITITGITIESLPIDIVAQTVGNIAIDIVAQTVGNINVNIAAQAANVNVNIAASAVTINVDVQNAYLYVRTEAAQNLNVDITAQTVGNLAVDITAQTVGNISIDIAAQTVGNLNVDIKAQTVDLNIKTSGGVNLVIDKLTQTAYVEDRRTLENKGATPSWTNPTGNLRDGKFFPRGCRGFLATIDVYCKDAGVAGGTITVYISPHPSMGYVASADVTVDAEQTAQWKSATFNRMWNYDSLFIFVVGSTSDMQHAYDSETPYDAYGSTDAGASWTHVDARRWFRAVMKAMTVGDLPVSGTINTIEIPSAGARNESGAIAADPEVEVTLIEFTGAGYVEYVLMVSEAAVKSEQDVYKIYRDGVEVFGADPDSLNIIGLTASSPKIQVLNHAVDGYCSIATSIRLDFKRSLKVTMTAVAGAGAHNSYATVYSNLIS